MSAFSRLGLACGIALALIGTGSAQAGIIRVHFDQDDYYILPGQTFQVQISYDWDYETAGDQPYGVGLLTAGLRVTYDPACVMAPALADIGVVSDLDHWYPLGPASPALRRIDSAVAYARFAGSVEELPGYDPPYVGTLLATYAFKDLSVGGSYVLESGRYNPPDNYWTTGLGGYLAEELLDWDNATVHVVPEPGTLVLLTLGGLVLARRYRRT